MKFSKKRKEKKMKMILLYVALGLLAHAFVLVPLLMGLALNKEKHRDGTGKLNFLKDSFILRRVYFGGDSDEIIECQKCTEDKMPKNICRLYWGIFWGVPIKTPVNILGMLIFLLWHAGAIFFGFWPKGHWKFHPYKKCGWNDEQKILLLPWEFLALLLVIFTVIHPTYVTTIAMQARNNPTVIEIFKAGMVCAMALAVLILFICSIVWIENKWAAPFQEFIKSKKQKWCLQINVE